MIGSGLAVGIDVTFAKKKVLPVVVARVVEGRVALIPRRQLPGPPPRGRGNLVLAMGSRSDDPTVQFAAATADFLDSVQRELDEPIGRIGIDAPRGPAPVGRLRASEQAMAEAGISFIQTPSDFEAVRARARASVEEGAPENRLAEANRSWMLVGRRLFEVLGDRFDHDRVIEVYPYAAFDRLAAAAHRKTSAEGVEERLRGLAAYAGWNSADELRRAVREATWGPMHDKADATLCAVLAARARVEDSFQGLATDPLDRIWMPASRGGAIKGVVETPGGSLGTPTSSA